MRTKVIIPILTLLALSGGTNMLCAEEVVTAAADVNDAAVKAVLEDPYKAKLLDLKAVRDKHQDEIRTIEAQIEARKKAMGEEDPELGKLAAEVAELAAKGEEMHAKLTAKYSGDAELRKLRQKATEIRAGYTSAQQKLGEEAEAVAKAREEMLAAAEEAAKKAAEEEAARKEAEKDKDRPIIDVGTPDTGEGDGGAEPAAEPAKDEVKKDAMILG